MHAVSISSMTSIREHLLLTAPDQATISRLRAMIIQSNFHVGLISDRLPLLANLSALENIALGSMYHRNMSLASCREQLRPAIKLLGVENVMDQRQQFLTRPQRLKVQLLRCMTNGSGFILLESPPRSDCDILGQALAILDARVFLWISCLSTDKDVYTSLGYTVIDLGSFL